MEPAKGFSRADINITKGADPWEVASSLWNYWNNHYKMLSTTKKPFFHILDKRYGYGNGSLPMNMTTDGLLKFVSGQAEELNEMNYANISSENNVFIDPIYNIEGKF